MSEQAVYLKCSRSGRHYRVVTLDKEKGVITLKGKHGSWVETLRPPAEFEAMGYPRIIGPVGLEMVDA